MSYLLLGHAWLVAASFASVTAGALPTENAHGPVPRRFAVMGDSDSHSYQDQYSFPPGSGARGGPYRPSTFQWTEVLMRLRAQYVDLGPWGDWGQRRPLAKLLDWMGMPSRSPRKQDYLYNMASSGAVCDDLVSGVFRQAPRLAELIRQEPSMWSSGVVVIRIGINDIGTYPMLDLMSGNPLAPEVIARSNNCKTRIQQAVQLLQSVQPALRFMVVSPFNDNNDPNNNASWNSAKAQANLARGFALLVDDLRSMSAVDPRIRFFDDSIWFRSHWGGRDGQGRPDYKVVRIGDFLQVSNTAGDAPTNAILSDDHAGLVWNTLWAQALVNELNSDWDLGIPEITDDEAARFVKSQLR